MTQADVTVRLARPDEGPLVGQLVKAWGGPGWDWLDWSNVYPYWLIGEIQGVPCGVIMAVPGKPFGRADFLATDPSLTKRQTAMMARDLGFAAVEACKQFGGQAVLSTFSDQDPSWQRIAHRRGWIPFNAGTFAMKRT
jgi:hypothetical protein